MATRTIATGKRRAAGEPATAAETDHVCVRHAICFQCFRAGVERARERRQAWLQRTLPFAEAPAALTSREIAHRQRMLDHLTRASRGA